MKHNIDVKRLLCPMPVIRLGEMIDKVDSGDLIEMVATDRCKVHGHKVIEISEETDEIILLVEKIG